ncbi:MAG: hypothetical protein ABJF11_02490 [Reichenbachiella sp.]|uniref:hypothetical protein n=1 Tax=Reichenbachiella sp. TaxID=2184521 RepID=UPI003265B364
MMKRLISLLSLILILASSANAQFYSGKFKSVPSLEDFDHFIVIQHPHHHKYGGTLSVKAFVKSGQLWHSKANPVDEETAERFIEKFGQELEILSVYELVIELDGEVWEFFMLGYENEDKKASFVVVEEIFNNIYDSEPIEVNTFTWDLVTAKR